MKERRFFVRGRTAISLGTSGAVKLETLTSGPTTIFASKQPRCGCDVRKQQRQAAHSRLDDFVESGVNRCVRTMIASYRHAANDVPTATIGGGAAFAAARC